MPRLLVLALFPCLILGTVHQLDAAKRRGATIVSPKRDAEVKRTTEVVGKLQVRGQPVVLIRPAEGDGVWWIQPVPQIGERGHFKTEVRFGSATAKKGDKFLLAVLVLRSVAEFEYLKDKDSLMGLPGNILQSTQLSVVLAEDAKKDPGPAPITSAVLKPKADSKVERVAELIGRVEEDKQPVVLVRVDDAGGLWWVQDGVEMGQSGYFKTTVRFGNAKTKSGTKFQILVVTPRTGQESEPLKPGKSLAELPFGIPRSKVISVVLHRPGEAVVKGAE